MGTAECERHKGVRHRQCASRTHQVLVGHYWGVEIYACGPPLEHSSSRVRSAATLKPTCQKCSKITFALTLTTRTASHPASSPRASPWLSAVPWLCSFGALRTTSSTGPAAQRWGVDMCVYMQEALARQSRLDRPAESVPPSPSSSSFPLSSLSSLCCSSSSPSAEMMRAPCRHAASKL